MMEFRIRPNGFDEIKTRIIVTMSIIYGVVIFVVVALPAIMSDSPSRFDTLYILGPLLLGVFSFSIMNALKKQRMIFESLTLRIDDEKIVREF